MTTVAPSGNMAGALFEMLKLVVTLSVAVAPFKNAWMAAFDCAVPFASVAATVMDAGAVSVGAFSSATVMLACAVCTLPAASVAVNVTVVVPIGKVAGASLVTVTWLSTLSVTVALARKAVIAGAVLAVPLLSVAETVILPGTLSTGLVWSVTLIVMV